MIHLSRLHRDQDGAAAVEFALILPIMAVTLFGLLDIGHAMYTRSLLQGAIEKAARDSGVEGANHAALDNKVRGIVGQIAPGSSLTFNRKSYPNFSNVAQPEDFTDANTNGVCDNGEAFEDANGSGSWDSDRGHNSQGGARDAVVYKVTVNYPRLFPVGTFIGQTNTSKMEAISVLRNQPFGAQLGGSQLGTCP